MNRYFSFIFVFLTTLALGAAPTGEYKKMVDWMQKLVSEHSGSVSLFSIGTNDEGTELYGIRISVNPTVVDASKIGHLVVGTHHGNETKAPVFVMRLAESLIERYEGRERWKGRLPETEWHIVPVLNVSGFNKSQRAEYGVDPNRDYPDVCTGEPGGKLKSILAIRNYMTSRVFTGTVTVHGYVGAITYPWGMNVANTHTLDHNQYEKITATAASINHYLHGTSTDVVYAASGTYEDYVYLQHGMWSLLLELLDGSDADIALTVPAIESFFDQLDSSPSQQHSLNTHCLGRRRDLSRE